MSPWLYIKAPRGSLANAIRSRNDRTDFPQASPSLFISFLEKAKKKKISLHYKQGSPLELPLTIKRPVRNGTELGDTMHPGKGEKHPRQEAPRDADFYCGRID